MKLNHYPLLSFKFFNRKAIWWVFQWSLVTLLGFIISLLCIEVGEQPELGMLEGVIGGFIIGLTQAIILSRFMSEIGLWMLVNAIAWGLMGGSDFGVMGWFAPARDLLPDRLIMGSLMGAIGGIWLGIWQWLALRKSCRYSGWWIAIAAMSWSIALPLGWAIGGILRSMTHLFLAEVIGLMITWIIVGVITGIVLLTFFSWQEEH